MRSNATVEIAIIGAGFGGIAAGMALRAAGHDDLVILDGQDGPGGVWRQNRYPGCASDMPGFLFSYRGEPARTIDLDGVPRADVLAYLQRILERHDLASSMRTGSHVIDVRWSSAACRWILRLRDKPPVEARFVIIATGTSGTVRWPEIEGLGSFDGPVVHTTAWQPEPGQFEGETVVIGSGASAVQVVPQLARTCVRLAVLQRTPRWVLPKPGSNMPRFLAQLGRPSLAKLLGRGLEAFIDHRAKAVLFSDPSTLGRLDRHYRTMMRRHVGDEDLARKVMPSSPFGCSRTLFSNDYFAALRMPHVTLGGAPSLVRADGVLDVSGEFHRADTIVLATGYNRFDRPLPIIGPDGRNLYDRWREAPQALLGVIAADMPNLIHMSGPNSGILNAAPRVLEVQAALAQRLIASTVAQGPEAVFMADRATVADFRDRLAPKLAGTVWASAHCQAWYTSLDPTNPVMWPDTLAAYRKLTANCDVASLVTACR